MNNLFMIFLKNCLSFFKTAIVRSLCKERHFFLHILFILSFCVLVIFPIRAFAIDDLRSTYPYLSGNTFRSYCDHVVDEYEWNLVPGNVSYGDTIFVKTEYLNAFFTRFHTEIKNPYILVTHNSDHPIPGPFAGYLDSPKLIAWFGQNVENVTHPKLHPIPIGLANRRWWDWCGSIETLQRMQKQKEAISKKIFVYLNINPKTNPGERGLVFEKFSPLPFCRWSGFISWDNYLTDLAASHFILSPRGNGLDCHRTWEALYMGTIPILRSSSSDSMYENLPVLFINDWDDVTFDFLQGKLKEMGDLEYNFEKLYADYWFDLINSFRRP